MAIRILLVIPDLELAAETKNVLSKKIAIPGEDLLVTIANNFREARSFVANDRYSLIIVHADIPREADAPIEEGANIGLEFLSWISKEKKIGAILVAPVYDNRASMNIQRLENCKYLVLDSEWMDSLVDFVGDMLGGETENLEQQPSQPNKRGTIDLILDLKEGACSYRIKGDGFGNEGPLIIDTEKFKTLKQLSDAIGKTDAPQWQVFYHSLGGDLKKMFIKENYKFYGDYRELLSIVGRKENINIRFVLSKEVHPIAFEALLTEEDKYWMLEAPIYRKIMSIPGRRPSLFQEQAGQKKQPIHCLIIEADVTKEVKVPGFRTGEDDILTLQPLKNVPEEAKWLEKFLEEKRKQFNIGEIRRVSKETFKGCFSEGLKNILESSEWNLVHYGGHSYYDDDKKTGYIFLPDKKIKTVEIETFSRWIKEAQFVFLSSCHSSAGDFVFELASNNIPAAVGFRWDIEDELAEKYVEIFYTNLFKEGISLEKAFYNARLEMYQLKKEKKIWAAPILVLQGGE